MVTTCKTYGGGKACDSPFWNFKFAQSIRGSTPCALGTWHSQTLKVCTDGTFAYGPFTHNQFQKCLKRFDEKFCQKLTWPLEDTRTFIDSNLGNVLQGGPSAPQGEIIAPNISNLTQKIFYATHYHTPIVNSLNSGHELLDATGKVLGPKLSTKDWCDAAMEGSVIVKLSDGTMETFNFHSTGSFEQVNCKSYFDHRPSHFVRFFKVNSRFGLGVSGYHLVPFRSVATDPKFVPTGSVLFIPEAKGVRVTLSDGTNWTHDGYFLAADVGGAIRGNHFDVFIGTSPKNPFSFVTSSSHSKKKAYLVTDATIRAKLRAMHLK